MTQSMLPSISRLPTFWNTSHLYFRFRDQASTTFWISEVVRCRQCRQWYIQNVGVAVEIASLSLSVQKLFLLTVSWPTINHVLRSWCRPMSGNVGGDISESDMVANVEVSVIYFRSKAISTSGFMADCQPHLSSEVGRCRAMSAVMYLSHPSLEKTVTKFELAVSSVNVERHSRSVTSV